MSFMSSASNKTRVVVVGAGVIGLTAALALADDGHAVTVVARDWPGDDSQDWCSPFAGALLSPHPDSEYPDLQRITWLAYKQIMQDKSSGVEELPVTELYDDRDESSPVWYEKDMENFRRLPSSELPTGTRIGYEYTGMMVNPEVFLRWLLKKLKARKSLFIRQTLSSLEEARQLAGAAVVINTSGLGAADLANDTNVLPVRGQTMLVNCKNYKRAIVRQGSQYTYAIPRLSEGTVVLGGVAEYGATERRAVPATRLDVLDRVNQMTNDWFNWVDVERDVRRDLVGFRPGRTGGMRLERDGNVIHAYGAQSLGYVYAFGVSQKILTLLSSPGNAPA